MAIIHQAEIKPSKAEVLEQILGGTVAVVGSYRFDDPAGEVGVEGFVVLRDDSLRHVVLTYRGAPLEGAGDHLVTTMEHSALGQRWVYGAAGDPVALGCFRRALLGEQEQARLDVYDGDRLVGTREPTVRLSIVPGVAEEGAALTVVDDLSAELDFSGPRLTAEWDGGSAVVAGLG